MSFKQVKQSPITSYKEIKNMEKVDLICKEQLSISHIQVDDSQPKLILKREQITPRGSRYEGDLKQQSSKNIAERAVSQGDQYQSEGYVSSDFEQNSSIFSSQTADKNSQLPPFQAPSRAAQKNLFMLKGQRNPSQNSIGRVDQQVIGRASLPNASPKGRTRQNSMMNQSKNASTTICGTTNNSTCSSPKDQDLKVESKESEEIQQVKCNNFMENKGLQLKAALQAQNGIILGLQDCDEALLDSQGRECEGGGKQLLSCEDLDSPVDLPESSLLQKHLRARNHNVQLINNKPPLSPFVKLSQPVVLDSMTVLQQHDPLQICNRQNIQNVNQPVSVEDQQFLQDLKNIQLVNNVGNPASAKKKLKKKKEKKTDAKLSQDGNKAQSFKSVTSYVLGDLDITKDDDEDMSDEAEAEELGSFDISSNTSAIHSSVERQSSSPQLKDASSKQDEIDGSASKSKRNNSTHNQGLNSAGRQLKEDKTSKFLNADAYKGFMAKESPFSFKNPIFFSCPNNKFQMTMKNRIGTPNGQSTNQLPPLKNSKRQLFTGGMKPIAEQKNYETHNIQHFRPNDMYAQYQQAGNLTHRSSNQDQLAQLQSAIANLQGLTQVRSHNHLPQEAMNETPIMKLMRNNSGSGFNNQVNLSNQAAPMKSFQPNQQFKSFTPTNKQMMDFEPKVEKKEEVMLDKTEANSKSKQLQYDSVESPISKQKYKNIQKLIDEWEKSEAPFPDLLKLTMKKMVLLDIPLKIQWRVFIDLADYAKRESRFETAAHLYKIVVASQPYAHQGWLEYAKMEEESGNQEACRSILQKGLKFNPLNENLFLKMIRIEEKRNDIESVRSMTQAVLESDNLNEVWKLLVEAALSEGRCGYKEEARKSFSYLTNTLKTNGYVFLEASKFEEREDEIEKAIDICDKGLDYNKKFGPLWFQYLKLYEKADDKLRQYKFDKPQLLIRDLFKHVSKDFHWKLNIELAQVFDRLGDQAKTCQFLRQVTLDCPDCVKWKIWLVASRIMQNQGQADTARYCIERSCMEVPMKQISTALLDYAKYFEMVGEDRRALQIMRRVRDQTNVEWKIQFEAVMMYMRMGRFDEAEMLVKESLELYCAKGRLWALLIQLQHQKAKTRADFEQAHKTFQIAVNEISKSGEVWCEGARLYLTQHKENPFFDIQTAMRFLDFAIQFTPQYGDSFLELLRASLLCKKLGIEVCYDGLDSEQLIHRTRQTCLHSEPNYGVLWFYYKTNMIDNAIDVWKHARVQIEYEFQAKPNNSVNWIGSKRLANLMTSGMVIGVTSAHNDKYCSYDEKMRVVYGFEQILPQIAAKKGE